MTLLEIILLSIGLAMDCFAVSTATGIACKDLQIRKASKMPILFGLFQGGMPLIGFVLSISFAEFIASFSHWIALAILCFLGGKMIFEEIHEVEEDETDTCTANHFGWKNVILLAIATSIDALATGILFVTTPEIIGLAIVIIALGSFLFSCIGLYLGQTFGKKMNIKAGILGGVILIAIGVKIVLEHYL
ncbi:MAG: manganese efflux pump MntP family protein [Bacteroidales bacterium]|nr:manganese efflux pump MntP family protein [Bacteroidales bacterium]